MEAGTGMTEAYDWRGRTVVDSDGDKVGKIDEIYVDEQSGEPEWALINTGLFGTKSNFVPLSGASPSGENVQIAHDSDKVKNAPSIDADGELSASEEEELYAYYGRDDYATSADTATGTVGQDTSGPETDQAMTRSEEELRVGTTQREAGRVRLKKYIVTENVQKTVPVQKEKVRIEREPITDGNVDAATDGPELSEEEHEITLNEEEVIVDKRTVPKERVRLDKDVEVEEKTVNEEVRSERIETEGDVDNR